MSGWDPQVANATAKDLVRIIDSDPDASQREIMMAHYIQKALDGEDISIIPKKR